MSLSIHPMNLEDASDLKKIASKPGKWNHHPYKNTSEKVVIKKDNEIIGFIQSKDVILVEEFFYNENASVSEEEFLRFALEQMKKESQHGGTILGFVHSGHKLLRTVLHGITKKIDYRKLHAWKMEE